MELNFDKWYKRLFYGLTFICSLASIQTKLKIGSFGPQCLEVHQIEFVVGKKTKALPEQMLINVSKASIGHNGLIKLCWFLCHHSDVTMGAMVSQITSLTIVYSTVYSSVDQRKYQSSVSLAFVRGIHQWPVNSPHKWPVTWKMFPFHDVIMVRMLGVVSAQPSPSVWRQSVGKSLPRSLSCCVWSMMGSFLAVG